MSQMDLLLLSETSAVRAKITAALHARGVGNVMIIDAAGPEKANRGGSTASLLRAQGMSVTVCDPLMERLPGLTGFDAVHMSGGNPFRLLRAARRVGLVQALLERAADRAFCLIGSSAGAMVLGSDISHADILEQRQGVSDATGFGFIDQPIMPHMDMPGRFGDILRDHVAEHPDRNWLLINQKDCIEMSIDAVRPAAPLVCG